MSFGEIYLVVSTTRINIQLILTNWTIPSSWTSPSLIQPSSRTVNNQGIHVLIRSQLVVVKKRSNGFQKSSGPKYRLNYFLWSSPRSTPIISGRWRGHACETCESGFSSCAARRGTLASVSNYANSRGASAAYLRGWIGPVSTAPRARS